MNIVSRVIFIFHLFCLATNAHSQNRNIELNKNIDTLKWINNSSHSFQMLKAKLLDIDTSQVFDSLRIRLFINSSLVSSNRVVEFSFCNSKWKGTLIFCDLKYSFEKEKFILYNIKRKKIEPKSGWNNLITTLIENNIMTLPDDDLILNYPMILDGVSYCIEICSKEQYRFYCYSNPDLAGEKIIQAKHMDEIVKIVYNEFIIN